MNKNYFKRNCAGLLLFALVVTQAACSRTSALAEAGQDVVVADYRGQAVSGGRLYFDHGTNCLTFYDGTLEESLPLCDTANCRHNTEYCNAYFPGWEVECYAIFGEQLLFWFDDRESDQYILYQADKNGANRKKVLELDVGVGLKSVIYTEDFLIYQAYTEEVNESKQQDEDSYANYYIERTDYLAYYDWTSGSVKETAVSHTSYFESLTLDYFYDGAIYYTLSRLSDGLDDATFRPEETADTSDLYIQEYYKLDLAAETITPLAFSNARQAIYYSDHYAGYAAEAEDGYDYYLTDLDTLEQEYLFHNDKRMAMIFLDGKIFYDNSPDESGRFCDTYYDLDTGKTATVEPDLPEGYRIVIEQETEDFFFGFLAIYEADLETQIGNNISIMIPKKDYYNGMTGYREISDMG